MLASMLDGVVEGTPWYWWAVGFGGQLVFGARFWVQWLVSERHKRSVVPHVFWHLSILGSVLTLAYAVYRLDPVFIMSNAGGLLIYSRNVYLIRTAAALRVENDALQRVQDGGGKKDPPDGGLG